MTASRGKHGHPVRRAVGAAANPNKNKAAGRAGAQRGLSPEALEMQHQARGLLPQGLCRVTGPQGCSAVLLRLLVCFPSSCDPAPAQTHSLRKVAVGPGISPASGGLCSPGLMTNNPVSNTTCGIGDSLAVLIKFQGAPGINGTEVV